MAEVGTVYVSVMPSTRGFAKALGSQGGAAGAAAGKNFNLSFGKLVGGSAIGNVLASTFDKAVGIVSSSLDSAFARADILNSFPKTMQSLGYSAEEAAGSIGTIKDHLNGLPSKTQDLATFVKQIAATGGTLQGATDVGLAFNDMLLASGASTEDASFSMQAFSKMLAGGKPEADNWMTLMQAMPGQMNLVAASLLGAGNDGWALQKAIKEGAVSMDDFKGAIVKAAQEGGEGFEAFSEAARTASGGVLTSLGLVKTRVANAAANVVSHIGVDKIAGAIDAFSSKISGIGDGVITFYDGVVSKIDFAGFESAFKGVADTMGSVFSQGDAATSFGEGVGSAFNMLIPLIQGATPIIQFLAQCLKYCADNAGLLIPLMITFAGALMLIKGATAVAPVLLNLTGGFTAMKPAVAANVPQLLALAVVAIALGAGIALACAGIYLLVQAAMQLSSAGPMAAVALVGLVAAIAGLAAGAAALGPALTAGSVGFIAFGAAILMVGAGIALVVASFALLATQLPMIAEFGMQAAGGILAISGAMLAFGASAVVAGAGMLAAAAGLGLLAGAAAAATLGIGAFALAVGAADLAIAAAALAVGALAAAVGLLAASVMITASGLTMMSAAMPAIGAAAPAAAAGLGALAAAAGASVVGIGACAPVLGAFAAAAAGAAAGALGAAAGIQAANGSSRALSSSLAISVARANVAASAFTVAGNTIGVAMEMAADRTESAMRRALSAVLVAAARINATKMEAKVNVTLGPLPHFSMVGEFNPKTGAVPTVHVDWYAKGGIFDRPTIIGVGERGREVVENVDRLDGRIRKAVTEAMGGRASAKQEFNIYSNNPEKVAAMVASRLRRSSAL